MIDLLPAPAACAQLGQRLRALRLGRNWTQAELAARAASSLSSIRRLESQGQATLELVVRTAQALQVADQLDALFKPEPVLSIAQAERLAVQQSQPRQRARRPGGGGPA